MTKFYKMVTCALILVFMVNSALTQEKITKYVRYTFQGRDVYGILEDKIIHELSGDLFSSPKITGKTVNLSDVHLLPPCQPSKVIAVGLNYRSHLGNQTVPEYPGLFSKFPTSIIAHDENIVMPTDAKNLHYEGEMVVVIGKKAQKVSVSEAKNYIFGITAGNDVSERAWQKNDLQWFRAKGSDTFGPLGPAIVTGLNYNDLLLQTRLNGEVRQSARTNDLIYDVSTIVSYVSQYVTLLPGDIIFTGTPGSTKAMQPGDIVEIELEGVGVLRNTVVAAKVRK